MNEISDGEKGAVLVADLRTLGEADTNIGFIYRLKLKTQARGPFFNCCRITLNN